MRGLWIVGLLAGCGVELGYPDMDEGGWFAEVPLTEPVGCAREYEPNDFENGDDYGSLGLVSLDRSPSVCGHLSSLGVNYNSGEYTGDVDIFVIETMREQRIVIDLDVHGSSDVDLHGQDGTTGEWRSDYDGEQLSFRPGVGLHLIQVSGVSGPPVDYTLVVWAE